jgi:CBS domain-containing protein
VEFKTKFIIADIMSKELVGVSPDTTAENAAIMMSENGISSLVVKEKGEIVGIVTDKDYAIKVSELSNLNKIKIKKMMSTNLISVTPSLHLQDAAEVIRKHNIRHLLVKTPIQYVGIVSVRDILSTLYEEIREQNTRLKKKIEELEKFYKVAVDRELVMVRLKKKVIELEKKLGEQTDFSSLLVE